MHKDDAIKEIRQLKELLDSGILSQDEYDVKSADLKKIILDSEKKNDKPLENKNLNDALFKQKKKNSKEQEESLWKIYLRGWFTSFRNLDPKNPREEWKCFRDRALTIIIGFSLVGLKDEDEPYVGFIAIVGLYLLPVLGSYFLSAFANIGLIFRVISGKITKKNTEWAKYESEILSKLTKEIFWRNVGKRNYLYTGFFTLFLLITIYEFLFE